jgi:hypothetical protein
MAGGLSLQVTASFLDRQYKLTYPFSKGGSFTEKPVKCY